MTNRLISDDGIAAIYRRECKPPNFAPELTAYWDSVGEVWTIGCGHTGDVYEGQTITREQADALFKADIAPCERVVNELVKVDLTQNQFDCLCSFVFNEGEPRFRTSTLLKIINAGKYDQVPAEMRKWVYAKKKVDTGLINRRNSEIGQWTKGAYVPGRAVQADTPPGWVREHAHKIITGIGGAGALADYVSVTQLQGAGQTLQSLAPNWHWFGPLGVVLIVLGVALSLRKQS